MNCKFFGMIIRFEKPNNCPFSIRYWDCIDEKYGYICSLLGNRNCNENIVVVGQLGGGQR
jgi:hypothetical protein